MTSQSTPMAESTLEAGQESKKALKTATIETRYGLMQAPAIEDDLIVRFLQTYGEWAEFEVDFIASNTQETARIADVGAFLGTFGIGLSQRVGLSSVCFVEANANVAPMLASNVAKNCRSKSQVVSALVSPTDQDPVVAYRRAGNEGSVSFVARSGTLPASDIPVPESRLSLRDLWANYGPFDLLKLDIEGMELPALREIRDILSGGSLAIWAECNEEPTSIDLAEFLISCGLRVFYFAFPSHNPENYRAESAPIFPYGYEAGLYAGPTEPHVPHTLVQRGCLFHEIPDGDALQNALRDTPRWCPPELARKRPEEAFAATLRKLSETNGALAEAQTKLGETNGALAEAQALLALRTQERDGLTGAIALAELAAAKRSVEVLKPKPARSHSRLSLLNRLFDPMLSYHRATRASRLASSLKRLHDLIERRAPRPLRPVVSLLRLFRERMRLHVRAIAHEQPFHPVNTRRAVINGAKSPRDRAIHWRRDVTERLIDLEELRSFLTAESFSDRSGLILSLSHDDYAVVTGGVQNCVSDEQSAFGRAGWTYIHIHPAQPLPMLADPTPSQKFLVGVRVNGKRAGLATFDTVIRLLSERRPLHSTMYVIVHHMLGFCPDLVVEATERVSPDEVVFWQHDFFSLCPNPALLRNDAQFCYGPTVASTACSVCVYGNERKQHFARISAAFQRLRPTVISPSKTAAEFWSERQIHPHGKLIVIPHGRVALAPPTFQQERGVLRVAFLGSPVYQKGWHIFEDLATYFAGDARYSFYHLGSPHSTSLPNIEHIDVSSSVGGRNAMTEAVYEREIDVVVNWSLCYETFSFTTYEALAGGAFVVARREAGNVWPAVQLVDAGRGCAIEDETALRRLFITGEIRRLAGSRRPGLLSLSGATADYLLVESPVQTQTIPL